MTASQNQQPFPYLSTEFVQENRKISIPWYKLLVSMWQKTGGGSISVADAAYLVIRSDNEGVDAYDSLTNNFIGTIGLHTSQGGPGTVLAPVTSPYSFSAPSLGFLIANSGKVEFSRDLGANWYTGSLTGGFLPMTTNDRARVTWFSNVVPTLVFMPWP